MKYTYCIGVTKNDALRESFQALTRKVFAFDFTEWYDNGYWTHRYIPHVLVNQDKVVSNVSVNLMTFDREGEVNSIFNLER